jgi:hypothetical protein
MKPVFAGARESFPTLHILASLPEKTRASRSNNFPGGSFTAAARFPKKSPMAPLCEAAFSCYVDK